MSYARFGAMIATSTVVMFALMYLNVYAIDHVFYSETMMWMAIYMGATMAIVMLFMPVASTRWRIAGHDPGGSGAASPKRRAIRSSSWR